MTSSASPIRTELSPFKREVLPLVEKTQETISQATDAPSIWTLTHGGTITGGQLAYTFYGDPKNPTIIVLGGISAGRDVAHCTNQYASGWWQCQIGPDKAIDLNDYSVIGIDYLGGAGESSSPDHSLHHSSLAVDSQDQAKAINALVNSLGIEQCYAVIGSSYGGMVTLTLAEHFPHIAQQFLTISAAHHSSVQSTGIRQIQRSIVKLGLEYGHTEESLALARALAMITYRSPDEFNERFVPTTSVNDEGFVSDIGEYLFCCGEKFSQQFPAEAFYCLSESIDLHSVDPRNIHAPLSCVAVETDQLIPKQLIMECCELSGADYIPIRSQYGHDAFLKETQTIQWIIQRFLRGKSL